MSKPLDIQVTASETGRDVDVRGSGPLTAARTAELAHVAERHHLARLTRHGDIVAQHAAPTVTMGRARVARCRRARFLQATTAGESALAALVSENCGRAASCVADLFAGVGPFALRLAERARVVAADSDANAIAAASSSARSRRRRATSRPRRWRVISFAGRSWRAS